MGGGDRRSQKRFLMFFRFAAAGFTGPGAR